MNNINYFAIGSMINKTQVNARGIFPSETKPAEIIDFALAFKGDEGMATATAVPSPGSSFHGVIHSVTQEEMTILDDIEMIYDRHDAKARLYDGTIVNVTVQSHKKNIMGLSSDGKPSERYISIIIQGCKYQGVKQDYIDNLCNIDYIPRPTEDELKIISYMDDSCKDKQYTLDEIKELNLKFDNIYQIVNGKVCKAENSSTHDFLKKFANRDITLWFAKNLQDPMFGIIESKDQITELHKKYIEDQFQKQTIAVGNLKEN